MGDHASNFQMALHDPASAYDTPEQVLADPRLDTEGRRAILRSWEHKARTGEGFPTGRPTGRQEPKQHGLVQRIRAALDELDARDRNHGHVSPHGRPGRRNA